MDHIEHTDLSKPPTSSKEARNWLTSNGVEQEHWQDIIDLGLYSNEIRKMAEIALRGDTTDVDDAFKKIVDNETDLSLKFKSVIDDFGNKSR